MEPSNVPVAAARSYTTTMQNLNRVILLIIFFSGLTYKHSCVILQKPIDKGA